MHGSIPGLVNILLWANREEGSDDGELIAL